MPTAFLTGGTGFVGGHVAGALLAEGWKVRALARPGAGRRHGGLEGLPVERVPGDLSEEAVLASAVAGCQAIVHVAGLVKARNLKDYREVNVHGTQRLLRAGGAAAPEALFLFLSSQAAVGPARDGRPVEEADPPRPVSWYGISKREGEELIRREWKGPWIILRPGVLYGPRDRALLLYFRMAVKGWLPVPASNSRIQVGSVEQAALAVAKATSRPDLSGRAGFLCDPEPRRISELAATIAQLPPRPARLVRVPDVLVRLAGSLETLREIASRRSRPFNADKAREILAGDWLCDPTPMRRDLQLPPATRLEEGLRAAWDWYRMAGWLAA